MRRRLRPRKRAAPPPPAEFAAGARLNYVSDTDPGLRRVRRGNGFSCVDTDGKPVRDRRTIARIRKLAIPPAYTDVWICADPRGHIQATGRDARRRKQYR
jgi:DNA topoisomerase-1